MENDFDSEETLDEGSETPASRDYSARKILIWEEDDAHRTKKLEFLTDLLAGAEIRAAATEAEAIAALNEDDWDTFVVDFSNENASSSEFVKLANNYPASILVALSLTFLELDEADNTKLEQIRRLFDIEKSASQIHA